MRIRPKPKYRTLPAAEVPRAPDMFDALSVKLDGAHSIVHLGQPGSRIRVFSPRISTITKRRIEYTDKLVGLPSRTPPSLANTLARAEVIAMKGRRSMGHTNTAAILNTKDPEEAKRKQRKLGLLRPFLFDVERFRGRDVRHLPPKEKLQILRQIKQRLRGFRIPTVYITKRAKTRAFKLVRAGKHPLSDEGFIGFNLNDHRSRPVKVKFRPDMDVWIRRIFRAKRPGWGEGFWYSLTKRGPIVGKVGTGFTQAQRESLIRNPEEWIGRKATVTYQKGGRRALRAPSFKRLHLDY